MLQELLLKIPQGQGTAFDAEFIAHILTNGTLGQTDSGLDILLIKQEARLLQLLAGCFQSAIGSLPLLMLSTQTPNPGATSTPGQESKTAQQQNASTYPIHRLYRLLF